MHGADRIAEHAWQVLTRLRSAHSAPGSVHAAPSRRGPVDTRLASQAHDSTSSSKWTRGWRAVGACALAAWMLPTAAWADERREPRQVALGVNLDLLPTVLSAANGKLGYAPQVWLGVGPVRVRFVVAHLEPPDALAFAPDGFHNPTTTAFATIIDYTFGPRLDGWWLGVGFEIWRQTIEHDDVADQAEWNSAVGTVGGGHIWRFAGDFFFDAWAGGHVVLDSKTVMLGAFAYDPSPLQGEVSVKVGWFFDL